MIQTALLVILVLLSVASLAWSVFVARSAHQQRERIEGLLEYLATSVATVRVGVNEFGDYGPMPDWSNPNPRPH